MHLIKKQGIITTFRQCDFSIKFPEVLSQNLSLNECVWEFQNNALWDTHKHALLCQTCIQTSKCHTANYIKNSYCFQLLEVCSPLAWLAGEKFSILCRCTSDGFGRMCDAYMKGCLLTDEMLEIHSMSVVDVSGTAGELLNPESRVSLQPCFPLSLPLNVVRV